MNKIKTLALVDDDAVFVYLTKIAIEETNLVELIKVFENGLDAITFLEENKDNLAVLPEVILLDLSMPIMNGWQFLEEFVMLNPSIGKKITIYVCSSSISPDEVNKAKSISEVTDFIVKPITKEKLIEAICKI